jgi:GDPmannose 4,6-dehydratase
LGNPEKAKRLLGWEATCTVEQLAAEMVQADLHIFKREKYLKEGGYDIKNQFE